MRRLASSAWFPYVTTTIAIALASVACQVLLDIWPSSGLVFAVYFAAVAYAVWSGGVFVGIYAMALSYLAANVLLVRPEDKFVINGIVVAYVFVCSSIVAFGETARRALRRAVANAEQTASILESMSDGYISIHLDGAIAYMNPVARQIHRLHEPEGAPQPNRKSFPPTMGEIAQTKLAEALARRVTVEFEHFYAPWDCWFEVKASPSNGGLAVYFRDVTNRRRAEAMLREADRRKDEFLAMLGHELRNPLAAISTAAEVLKYIDGLQPEVVEVRSLVERQAGQMRRLIDDLLDVSRIARGKVTLRTMRLDLAAVVRQIADDHKSRLQEQAIVLELETPREPIWIEGDSARMAQVVGNLLDNAIKFTDHGGRIRLCAAKSADEKVATVVVRDTGVGISPDVKASLFVPFAQAEATLGRSSSGLGLGLALVKGLVELHGGTIDAHSDGPGLGSTFTVRLPLADAPAAAKAKDTNGAAKSKSCRALIVEDNNDVARPIARLLELNGHQVAVAGDGASGIELAREFKPDIVFCDIGLPGEVDGYDVARRLRADAATHAAYLVAVTGFGQEEDRRRAFEAGFGRHITKPPDYGELVALVAEVATRREQVA
jgi:signal transduction histidine kinase/ActR/RegA family two-component response regulator